MELWLAVSFQRPWTNPKQEHPIESFFGMLISSPAICAWESYGNKSSQLMRAQNESQTLPVSSIKWTL